MSVAVNARCRSCKGPIEKDEDLWVDPDGQDECKQSDEGDEGHVPIGCPNCGRTEHIEANVRAFCTVDLGLGSGHVDEIEWGAARDVDLDEALTVKCWVCGWTEDVSGDLGAFRALGLEMA